LYEDQGGKKGGFPGINLKGFPVPRKPRRGEKRKAAQCELSEGNDQSKKHPRLGGKGGIDPGGRTVTRLEK